MNVRLARTARTWWSRSLIASLLFLQLATAAYACAMQSAPRAVASTAGMPCAQEMAAEGMAAMDPDQPGLCLEHCKGGSQTIEPAVQGALPAPELDALFVVAAPVGPAVQASASRAWQFERDSIPPLPHSILHCCFRI